MYACSICVYVWVIRACACIRICLLQVGECVDLGVYTRNRCFRLFNSTKFGKNTTFQFSERDHAFKWRPEQSNAFMKMLFEPPTSRPGEVKFLKSQCPSKFVQ
jgi:hypothetical protein